MIETSETSRVSIWRLFQCRTSFRVELEVGDRLDWSFSFGRRFAAIAVKDTGSPAGSDYLRFNEMAIADDGKSAFVARTTDGDTHITDDGTSATLLVGSPPPGDRRTAAGGQLVHAGALFLWPII